MRYVTSILHGNADERPSVLVDQVTADRKTNIFLSTTISNNQRQLELNFPRPMASPGAAGMFTNKIETRNLNKYAR